MQMTDGEKPNLIFEKVTGLEKDVIDVKADLKQTERVLKNEIRKECGLVLDEHISQIPV